MELKKSALLVVPLFVLISITLLHPSECTISKSDPKKSKSKSSSSSAVVIKANIELFFFFSFNIYCLLILYCFFSVGGYRRIHWMNRSLIGTLSKLTLEPRRFCQITKHTAPKQVKRGLNKQFLDMLLQLINFLHFTFFASTNAIDNFFTVYSLCSGITMAMM